MDNDAMKQFLADMQTELARELLKQIRAGDATASTLNVARQFLKDNGIDATPEGNPEMGNLAERLGDVELPPIGRIG